MVRVRLLYRLGRCYFSVFQSAVDYKKSAAYFFTTGNERSELVSLAIRYFQQVTEALDMRGIITPPLPAKPRLVLRDFNLKIRTHHLLCVRFQNTNIRYRQHQRLHIKNCRSMFHFILYIWDESWGNKYGRTFLLKHFLSSILLSYTYTRRFLNTAWKIWIVFDF